MKYHIPRLVTPEEAVACVRSDSHIYIQGSTSIPETLVSAMAKRGKELRNVRIHSGFSVARREAPYCTDALADAFVVDTCFVSNNVRDWIRRGCGTTTPMFLGEVPQLFADGSWPIDVALLNCSLPNEEGYVSYGISADLAVGAVRSARKVIAQINPHVPFSYGDALIHVNDLHAAVLVDDPLVEVPTPQPGPVETAIGNAVAERIPDGATIQIGVGAIPNAVISALADHRHLGLHTEAMTDGVLPLINSGVIDNSLKKVLAGKCVASLALGSRHLYDLMDYNRDMVFKDVAWTNDPFIIAQNPKVVSINSCLEIDLTGQICADSIGENVYSGIGGQHDFVYGAARSQGGMSFIAMTSTTSRGVGKIKATLTPGAGVTTTRFQAHHIVTEYGCVNLRGCSLEERARRLISIANPSDRETLTREARRRFGRLFHL